MGLEDWYELGRKGVAWKDDPEGEALVKALPNGSPELAAWFDGVQMGHAERRIPMRPFASPGSQLPADVIKKGPT